jgi:uncharacterized cupin superfamily protein
MTNPDFVIPFETATYPTLTCIDDPALVDTPYSSKSWRCFTDASGRAVSGIWEAGPHFERCICDFDEMCHILEGEVRLTDASGRMKIFGPNDSFVVAAGFDGTWENLSYVRKVFFILNAVPSKGTVIQNHLR